MNKPTKDQMLALIKSTYNLLVARDGHNESINRSKAERQLREFLDVMPKLDALENRLNSLHPDRIPREGDAYRPIVHSSPMCILGVIGDTKSGIAAETLNRNGLYFHESVLVADLLWNDKGFWELIKS